MTLPRAAACVAAATLALSLSPLTSADAAGKHFRTVVNGKQVEGIDLLHLDGDEIATFTVMIRPMSAVQTVSEAVYAGLAADGVLG